ncbi:MAG: hypothetical protein R2932_39875 [Caldilineaceae bacterium]
MAMTSGWNHAGDSWPARSRHSTLGTMLYWAINYQAVLLGRWWWSAAPFAGGVTVRSALLALGQHQ